MINKSLAVIPMLMLGCLVAGLYGAVHDQLSYTISPEYFHCFKFEQFHIDPSLHNRFGAAQVGAMATWWLGILIGVPLLGLGLFLLPGVRLFVQKSITAIGVVLLTAIGVGLAGMMGFSWLASESLLNRPIVGLAHPVTDPVRFRIVGALHDFSYLGGAVGLIVAGIYLVVVARRQRLRARQVESALASPT